MSDKEELGKPRLRPAASVEAEAMGHFDEGAGA